MTEITHLRCDRCSRDVAFDNQSLRREKGWVRCRVDLDGIDFCPACWKAIMDAAGIDIEALVAR
jgi:hypothetical protein